MTWQEIGDLFNTGDCLIEVIAIAGLTVCEFGKGSTFYFQLDSQSVFVKAYLHYEGRVKYVTQNIMNKQGKLL